MNFHDEKELIEYITNTADHRGLPNIPNDVWLDIVNKYEKNVIRNIFAKYICDNNIPFPHKEIDQYTLSRLFYDFSRKSMIGLYKDFVDVKERYDYKYKYEHRPAGCN